MAGRALAVKRPSVARMESNSVLRDWGESVTGRVLSIGSSTDADGEGHTYRSYFHDATHYDTSEPSPGCDLVLDVRAMPTVPDASYDAVFCSGVLEHVDDCHAAVRECRRIMTPGGSLLLGLPCQQPIHRAPQDFWRFTEYGIRYMLREFTIKALVGIGDPAYPTTYWTWAVK